MEEEVVAAAVEMVEEEITREMATEGGTRSRR